MKPLTAQDSYALPNLANVDRRLALAFGGLIFVLMVAVLLAGGLYLRGVMENEQDRLSTLTTRVLANAVSRVSFSGKYHARLMLEEIKEAQPGILYLRLVDSQGRILAHSDPAQNDQTVDPAALAAVRAVLDGQSPLRVRQYQLAGEPVREVSLTYRGGYDNAVMGVIQVGISESDRQRALEKGLLFIAVVVAVLLLVGIYVTLRISAHFGNPIRQVAQALEHERAHLSESEAKYRRIVDTANEGIWVLGPDTMTTSVNARMAEMLGYSAEEMTGKPLTAFMFEEDLPDHARKMENRRQGVAEHYERRFRRKDGETVWALAAAAPIFDDEHGFQGSFAMVTDITGRRRAEDDLRLMNERFALATAAARMGVWDWYIESDKLVWDDGMYELYGMKRGDFAGATMRGCRACTQTTVHLPTRP